MEREARSEFIVEFLQKNQDCQCRMYKREECGTCVLISLMEFALPISYDGEVSMQF